MKGDIIYLFQNKLAKFMSEGFLGYYSASSVSMIY